MNHFISFIKNTIKNPLSNIPSLFFLGVGIFGLVTLFSLLITDLLVFPFVLISTIATFIAMWYIGVLGTLKENLEKMEKSIEELKNNNDRLRMELNSMEELRKNLEKYADKNNKDFKKVLTDINSSFKRLENITIENEKTLLYRIAQDLEFMDKKAGMSRDEYQRFIKRIPLYLQNSFVSLGDKTFEEVAGEDKNIDYKEIEQLIQTIIKK